MLAVVIAVPVRATADADDDGDVSDPEDPDDQLPDAGPSTSHDLLTEATRELAATRESHYAHHTHVDERTGHFDYDCSGFVGYALSRSAPDAWKALQTIRKRPLAASFEAMFDAPKKPWTAVAKPSELRPGDVIAWLEPPAKHSKNTGHVMIVASAPHAGTRADELVVTVIDSSHSGHGNDDRVRDHRGGLGRGDLVLQTDSTGHAIGYRWSTRATSKLYTTAIRFGRLNKS